MNTSCATDTPTHSGYLRADLCQVCDLERLLQTPAQDCPQATAILQGVPIYEGPALRAAHTVVDAAAVEFRALSEEARAAGQGGDHFAKPGANDRVWNALEKLCLRAPDVFAAYYGNALLATVFEAWLGPAWQLTSQINSVNPGGAAQTAHRDYHLGFFTAAGAERFPAHVHRLSPFLTLQGAVAHVDMPLESGPTLYLPHSQKYEACYLVADLPAFQQYFERQHVQLPLKKGDGIFFNPALLHAAGHNRSADIRRMANLLQVSSAFGRCMEAVDRMIETDYGFSIANPAFTKFDERIGKFSASRPYVAENGGCYNHAAGFKLVADCMLGRAEQAWRTFLKVAPGSPWNPVSNSCLEPFSFTNCYSLTSDWPGMAMLSSARMTVLWALRRRPAKASPAMKVSTSRSATLTGMRPGSLNLRRAARCINISSPSNRIRTAQRSVWFPSTFPVRRRRATELCRTRRTVSPTG